MLQPIFHYFFHFVGPFIIAWAFFRSDYKRVGLVLLSTMLVDLDHLLADPVFDPERCGIGFHPLHSFYAILAYVILVLIPSKWVRIIGIGMLFHMFTDFLDCLWIFSKCEACFESSKIYELLN